MSVTPIIALDVGSAEDALRLVAAFDGECDFFKVGSELFTAAGPVVVRLLRERGARVFLDLKLHDIPTTVERAARAAASLEASLLTVHLVGGAAMLEAAAAGAGPGCGVLGVTVITSLDGRSLAATWGRNELSIGDEVLRLAEMAKAASLHGVVCAGSEAFAIRSRYGDALRVLIPGVRFAGHDRHEQSRSVTPAEAALAGASYVVLGRAVTGAPDPAAAFRRARAEIVAAATARTASF